MTQRLLVILAAISGDRLAHRSWEWRAYDGADAVPQDVKDACGIKDGRRFYFWRFGPAKSRAPRRVKPRAVKAQGVLPLEPPE